MSFRPESTCAICRKTGDQLKDADLKRCSYCKVVYYCGRNCQRRNFNDHSLICKRIKNHDEKIVSMETKLKEKDLFEKFNGKFTKGPPLTIQYYETKFAAARLIWFLAREHESYEAVKVVKGHLVDLVKLDLEKSANDVFPWLCFTYLFLGKEQTAYDVLKLALKPNAKNLVQQLDAIDSKDVVGQTNKVTHVTEEDITDGFNKNETLACVLIVLKTKLIKRLLQEEHQWNKLSKKLKSAPKDSLSGKFCQSTRLMNCLELYIKGVPKDHDKKISEQKVQLCFYLKIFNKYLSKQPDLAVGNTGRPDVIDEDFLKRFEKESTDTWALYSAYFKKFKNELKIMPYDSKAKLQAENLIIEF